MDEDDAWRILNMKKIEIKIKVDKIKVRDEDHFKAQLLYPKRVSEDKTKYKRSREKKQLMNILENL